jgi:hypothetical protein
MVASPYKLLLHLKYWIIRSEHVYGENKGAKNCAKVSLRQHKLIPYFNYHIIIQTLRASQTKVHDGEDLIQTSKKETCTSIEMDSRKRQLPTAQLLLTYEKNNKKSLFWMLKFIFRVVTPRDFRLDTDVQVKHGSPVRKEGRRRLINKLKCYEGNVK